MKRIMFLLFISGFLWSGCSKSEDAGAPTDNFSNENEAVITGYDFTECGCCGGYIISIVSNPPYGKDFLARELPGNIQLQPGSNDFPLYVRMTWATDTTACDSKYINILSMEKK